MRDFQLEPQQNPDCRIEWDLMRVYDSAVPDESALLGKHCGDDVPYIFRSTGRSMFVNFQSDGTINFPGFEAAYYFVEGRLYDPLYKLSAGFYGSKTL